MAQLTLTTGQAEALSRFFRMYFYADFLEQPTDLSEAIDAYLTSEGIDDPAGRDLLSGLRQLVVTGLSERELRVLIERRWQAESVAAVMGIEYSDILPELIEKLEVEA